MSNDFEHAQRIIKSQSESIENLIKTISTYIEICDIRQTTIKRLQDENESWMNLSDKYLKKIADLEDWNSHHDGEIEYYQRKVEELSELNHSYKETIKDLNDRLTDKYKLFRPTVPDMKQVNKSLDREPEEIDSLRRIVEQLHNERLGINPVV